MWYNLNMEVNKEIQDFIYEYIEDFNGTRAAKAIGKNPKTAYHWAYRILKKAEVQAAIRQELKDRANLLQMDESFILKKIKNILEADFVTPLTNMKEDGLNAIPKELRKYVKAIKSVHNLATDTLTHQVTFMCKDNALNILTKYIDFDKAKDSHITNNSINIDYEDKEL